MMTGLFILFALLIFLVMFAIVFTIVISIPTLLESIKKAKELMAEMEKIKND